MIPRHFRAWDIFCLAMNGVEKSFESQRNIPKVSKSVTNPMFPVAIEIEELKDRLTAIKEWIYSIL